MQTRACVLLIIGGLALSPRASVHAQPNNLNPTNSLCLKLHGVNAVNTQGPCLSEDIDCGADPALRCTDDDSNPLNGGICVDRNCFDLPATFTVDIELGPTSEPACGAQLFLSYGVGTLDLLDRVIEPDGEFGWSQILFNNVDTVQGTIDVAIGLPIGQQCNAATGTVDGGTLLRLTFANTVPCEVLDLQFRASKIPTNVGGANGAIGLVGCNGETQPSALDITIKEPPVWTCPPNSAGNADCARVTREVLFDPFSVADPCEETTAPAGELCTVTYFKSCTADPDCAGSGACTGGTCEFLTVPDGVDLQALLDGGGDFLPGRTEFRCGYTNQCGLSETCAVDISNSGVFIPDDCPRILHVDQNVLGGGNDGLTWCSAFSRVEDALAEAAASNGWIEEIRVAGGVYRPAPPVGDRLATFRLVNGAALVGGYAGCLAPDSDHRDTVFHETILSGDLNGDDGLDMTSIDDNSFHVVTADGNDETAFIDGFTITAATADDKSPHNTGGGIYVTGGSATIARCVLKNNAAMIGAAIGNQSADPVILNTRFAFNTASDVGGGIGNIDSSPTLINCTFGSNTAQTLGGAMYSDADSAPVVRNSIIWENGSAPLAGAATVTFSVVQGGWDGEGNLDTDPLFANADVGIFQLSATSPALDSGNNTFVPPGVTVDLIGSPRFVNDPFTPESGTPGPSEGPVVDMGSFELLLGDSAQDGDVDLDDYQLFFECAESAGGGGTIPPECIRNDFDGDGDIDLIDMIGFQIAFTGEPIVPESP